MSRTSLTQAQIEGLPIGSVVALTKDAKIINVAFKDPEGSWALAGKPHPFVTADLYRLAVDRDGFTLTELPTA